MVKNLIERTRIPLIKGYSETFVDPVKPQNVSSMPYFLVEALGSLLRYWDANVGKRRRLLIRSTKGTLGLITLSEKGFQVTLKKDILSGWMDERFEFQMIPWEAENISACPDTSKTEK